MGGIILGEIYGGALFSFRVDIDFEEIKQFPCPSEPINFCATVVYLDHPGCHALRFTAAYIFPTAQPKSETIGLLTNQHSQQLDDSIPIGRLLRGTSITRKVFRVQGLVRRHWDLGTL